MSLTVLCLMDVKDAGGHVVSESLLFLAIAFFRTNFASRRVVRASLIVDVGINNSEFDVLKESDEVNRNDICVFIFAYFVKILRKMQIE